MIGSTLKTRRGASWLGVTIAVASFGACGTTYNIHHVPQNELRQSRNAEGLFFALPRTTVSLEFVVTKTTVSIGRFYDGKERVYPDNAADIRTFEDILKANRAACAARPRGQVHLIPQATLNPLPTYSAAEYAISTRSVPDLDKIYYVALDPGAFASYAHTLEWNDDGTLKSSNTKVENAAAAFALKVTESVVKIAAASLGAQTTPPDYCDQLAALDVEKGVFDKKGEEFKTKRAAILDRALATAEAATLTAVLADNDKQLAALRKTYAPLLKHYEKSQETESYVIVGDVTPSDFSTSATAQTITWQTYKPKFERSKEEADKPKRLPLAPGSALATLEPIPTPPDIDKDLQKIKIAFTPAMGVQPPSAAGKPPAQKGGAGGSAQKPKSQPTGYPYRFPVAATAEIKRPDDGGTEIVVAKAAVPVVQFGPMITLPRRFDGTSGQVDLAYNNATGGLTKATLGAKPVSDSALSSYIDIAGGYLDAEREAEEAAAAKAKADADKAASAETDALLKEKAYLEALKAVRGLRAELGVGAGD